MLLPVLLASSSTPTTLVKLYASSHSPKESKEEATIVTNNSMMDILVLLANTITGILLVSTHASSPSLIKMHQEIVPTACHPAQLVNPTIGMILVSIAVTLLYQKESLEVSAIVTISVMTMNI